MMLNPYDLARAGYGRDLLEMGGPKLPSQAPVAQPQMAPQAPMSLAPDNPGPMAAPQPQQQGNGMSLNMLASLMGGDQRKQGGGLMSGILRAATGIGKLGNSFGGGGGAPTGNLGGLY